MAKTYPLHVALFDERALPLADVVVRVALLAQSFGAGVIVPGAQYDRTDDDGRARFDLLPASGLYEMVLPGLPTRHGDAAPSFKFRFLGETWLNDDSISNGFNAGQAEPDGFGRPPHGTASACLYQQDGNEIAQNGTRPSTFELMYKLTEDDVASKDPLPGTYDAAGKRMMDIMAIPEGLIVPVSPDGWRGVPVEPDGKPTRLAVTAEGWQFRLGGDHTHGVLFKTAAGQATRLDAAGQVGLDEFYPHGFDRTRAPLD